MFGVNLFSNSTTLLDALSTGGGGKYRLGRHATAALLNASQSGVDYGMTHSCYDPDADGRACGRCDSCVLRKRGFSEAGVPDPTRYAD